MNSKVPEKQCFSTAKSCNCYVFMYQDAFRFFVLLKNMLFCYSLLAATNHKTYQQIERSNNFFQKKIAHHWRYGRSPCGEKKPPGRMRGISFVSQTGWWRRGESNSRRRRFHALSQKPSLQALPEPLCGLLLGSHLFLQLILYLLMGPVPGLMAFAAKDHEVGHCIVPTVRQGDSVVLLEPGSRGLDLALCAMTDGAHRSVETAESGPLRSCCAAFCWPWRPFPLDRWALRTPGRPTKPRPQNRRSAAGQDTPVRGRQGTRGRRTSCRFSAPASWKTTAQTATVPATSAAPGQPSRRVSIW